MHPQPFSRLDERAVSIKDLSYRYPGSAGPSLKRINLEISKGQCFGLLGPNGAGKTTLLGVLTGVLEAQSGEVMINGVPLSRSKKIQQISAVVPQDLAFYPDLTGRENLHCFAGFHGLSGEARRAAVAGVIETCQLGEVADKRAENYSGGLKRRLNLAIGLLNEPKVLYLDEPTVGIDAQSRNFILEAIQSLKDAGTTVIYTSHYMEEVQMICDEIAIIDHGSVVFQSGLDVLVEAQAPVLHARVHAEPSAEQLQQIAALGECQVRGRQLKVTLRDQGTELLQVAQLFDSLQLRVEQINFGMNRLEEIYLSITKYDLRD